MLVLELTATKQLCSSRLYIYILPILLSLFSVPSFPPTPPSLRLSPSVTSAGVSQPLGEWRAGVQLSLLVIGVHETSTSQPHASAIGPVLSFQWRTPIRVTFPPGSCEQLAPPPPSPLRNMKCFPSVEPTQLLRHLPHFNRWRVPS